MKKLMLFCAVLMLAFACNQAPKNQGYDTEDTADITAINDVIHGFYGWYDGVLHDTTKQIKFTDATGAHLKLNPANLDAYFAQFKASGFVSDEFIENEKKFYRSCEKFWQKEAIDDVPSCLDADKYFCAQDWDIKEWTSNPTTVEITGKDKAKASMTFKFGDTSEDRNFELIKKDGKWLLLSIECDMLPE